MTAPQVAPGKTELRRFLSRGLTQQQIVAEWERDSGHRVSRSTIAMAIARYGLNSAHPRPRYEDTLPWIVKEEHTYHRDARMLRLEGRRRSGRKLTTKERRLLQAWRDQLDEAGAVVHYDPDTEQGFWWVYRDPTDGDDIVRRPT
jgi:hypothetical protein